VFERFKSPWRGAASPALEYLGHVLPRGVFRPVQRIFQASGVAKPDGATGDAHVAERIRQAWESDDEWLRACAIHASRAIAGFDTRLFSTVEDGSALVRTELAALAHSTGPVIAPSETQPC
jgi:hypothetical protein